jgi:hypothetical protein
MHISLCSAQSARRACFLLALCLILALAGCAGKLGPKKEAAPADSNQKEMAYGASVSLGANWNMAALLDPKAVSKADLETRSRQQRILLLAAAGPASSRAIQPNFTASLVSQEGNFLPREFAEKLQPEEFQALSRDIFQREKETAKKNKVEFNIMDLQLSRENINGNFAVHHKITVADPKGVPVRLLRWDVYLSGTSGIVLLAECDSDQPGMEGEILSIARSLRVQ